ncbi:hypothetical protein [Kitasatospora sp. LaBMicrA B282]|uniref:hypothetical protein n=1 Tax=Kitasatospora sp. LaBMicrA B282 TaxID=3420949 RepID=UPI003D0C7808
MNRDDRLSSSNNPMRAARRGARVDRINRSMADVRAADARAAARSEARSASGAAEPVDFGSVRHTLVVLGQLVPIALLLLGLAAGLPGLGLGAVLLGGAALVTARYVVGAGSEPRIWQPRTRLMGSQTPSLSDWRWTVRNGLDPANPPHPLRARLRRLYAARLAERHGVSLRAEPARAAALVGPEVWPWLDPAHPEAGGALSPEVLTLLIDRLEAL